MTAVDVVRTPGPILPAPSGGPIPYDQMKNILGKEGYITNDPVLVTRVSTALHDVTLSRKGIVCVLLDGPPGVGKTFLAQTVAKYLQAEFLQIQFTVGVGRDIMMHDIDIAAVISTQVQAHVAGAMGTPLEVDSDSLIIPGVLQQSLVSSHQAMTVVLLDEIDKAKPNVDSMLLEYLQEGYIQHPTQRGKVIRGNMNQLVVFITKNNERDITEPLIRRMDVVYLNWPSPDTEQAIAIKMARSYLNGWSVKGDIAGCAHTFITYANKIREKGKLLRKVPSSQELAKGTADVLRWPKEMRGHLALGALFKYEEDKQEYNRSVQGTNEELTPEKLKRELAGF